MPGPFALGYFKWTQHKGCEEDGTEVESQNSHAVVRAPPGERGRKNGSVLGGGERQSNIGQTKHWSNSSSVDAAQPCLLSLPALLFFYSLKFLLRHLISCSPEEVSICHYGCDFAGTGVEQDSVNGVNSFSTMNGTLGIWLSCIRVVEKYNFIPFYDVHG